MSNGESLPADGALSYVCGSAAEPLRYETVGGVLTRAAARWSEREALAVRHQGVRLTYRQLNELTDEIAAGFLAMGLEPGERIGIWAPNCLEWVLTQFASAKAGLILVNINPAYRAAELAYALAKVGCRALVLAPRFKTSDYVRMLAELLPEIAGGEQRTLRAATATAAAIAGGGGEGKLHAAALPELRWLITTGADSTPGFLPFDTVRTLATAQMRRRVRELAGTLQADEPINIQFTSGTTGAPKGATLSHFNIVNNGYFVAEAIELTEQDRMCIPVPLYHCFGMVMGNLGCVTHGAAMVYPSDGFDPRRTLETVQAERCTALYGVPTMFIAQLELPDFASFDLSSLRTGIMAGAPCPIAIMRRVIGEMHMSKVTIAYGMTETSPVSFQSAVTDTIEQRVTTVGRVHPHLQVKLVDRAGRIVPRGTAGELCTRGYSVMRGYWDDAEQTRAAIDEAGWMHTGDLAALDPRGYCNITGRLKDVIIRGGEKISPREVEEFLYGHPQVLAVQVFGIPDARYGEAVCAWVQLRPDQSLLPEQLQEYCRGRIAHQKVPGHVRIVTEFPLTATGKVQKFVMRERMIAELGLRVAATA